ncbi:hypothetical protein PHSY_003077 [Pseudozyma hubeiensis SY62]|uniref:Uncharacterized protein n=1 Tax=Pseudozyma hubeiensis (strain SY62) TaxID=1305764 RepID=R9P2F4_PSEHS|nr:hypothetical protein PHSY_003077 [Pseudozyma hubeiensis SY62]GAC95501.1 hypothetical protein PHSY_003077 [Pseudozyma hubeiensis SY62]
MSLGKVDDVFCDSSRSVDRLRQHYLAMPATPSTISGGSSPGARTERLPSLSDLFHRDILSPPSSSILPLSSVRSDRDGTGMQRAGSTSSTCSTLSRLWVPPFHQDSRAGSIGPPATPLTPFFNTATPLVSPTTVSPDRHSITVHGFSEGERTPKALQRPSFDFTVPSSGSGSSPVCPGAPLIGAQGPGHFESQAAHQQQGTSSLGSFVGIRGRSSYEGRRGIPLSKEDLERERATMSRLDAEMPKAAGMCGLGIYMDENNVQSPFRTGATRASGLIESETTSPSSRTTVVNDHTGLTPMVKASKVSDSSSTPTRSKGKKSPGTSQDKTSPSATAPKKRIEAAKTPLSKSRPMFRLDNGSSKKSSKPKGHKMNPGASPWGVFGTKDGWKPLAQPNVSRAIAEASKFVSETSALASSSKTSPTGKREALSAETSSPLKRSRVIESQVASSSPYKENVAPPARALSPSKRAHMMTAAHRDSPTALPLSTIR